MLWNKSNVNRRGALRSSKLRIENLEERQLLTAVGAFDVPYGPEPAPVVCVAPVDEAPAINLTGVDSSVGTELVLATIGETQAKTWTVTSNLDDGGDGTLRYAIKNASDGDTIIFDKETFQNNGKITLTKGQLEINKSLTIDASDQYDSTTGTPGITISGNHETRVMKISGGTEDCPITLIGLTIAEGCSSIEESYDGNSDGCGAGIYLCSNSVLKTDRVTISDNCLYSKPQSSYDCYYLDACGGGVYVGSYATFTSIDTEISGNSIYLEGYLEKVDDGGEWEEWEEEWEEWEECDKYDVCYGCAFGGGVCVESNATFTAVNTEICSNYVDYNYADPEFGEINSTWGGDAVGGGVHVSGTFTATNTTIAYNNLWSPENEVRGGGVDVSGTFTATNTTIVGNYEDGVCVSGTFNSYNSIIVENYGEDIYVPWYEENAKVNGWNTASSYKSWNEGEDNIVPSDDQLEGLFNNPSKGDYSLKEGSIAINAGNNEYVADITTDIEGLPRIASGTVDLGAYEYHYTVNGVWIEGTAEVGQTLTAHVQTSESEPVCTYKWYRGEEEIEGATDKAYVVTLDDCGCELTVKATGTQGLLGEVTSDPATVSATNVVIEPSLDNLTKALGKIEDGGKITFKESSVAQTISVTSAILIDKSVTIDGTDAKLTFDGGETSQIFTVASGANVELKYLTLKNGKSANGVNGGAIVNNGKLTLTNITATANVAGKNGGAVFNNLDATLTVKGGTYSDNVATLNGGAFANYGSMTIEGDSLTTISGNHALKFGGAYFGCGTLSVTGKANFTGNYVTAEGSRGGAIYNDVRKDADGNVLNEGNVSITGTVNFKNNTALERGGAIESYSTLSVAGTTTFTGNKVGRSVGGTAKGYGGAIDVGDGVVAILGEDVKIGGTGNNDANTAEIGGAVFSSGTLIVNGGTYSGNVATMNGGAFANYGTMTISDDDTTTTISNNQASKFGGAYFGCGQLEVTGKANFTGNYVTAEGSRGGAIYNDVRKDADGNVLNEGNVSITGTVNFKNNTALERGGAIESYSTLSVAGTTTFTGNKVGSSVGGTVKGYAGAIDVGQGCKAVLDGTLKFDGNTAEFGGAIFSVDDLTLKATGNYKFIGNTATKSGGAINASNGNLNLAGEFTFESNEANGDYDEDKSGLGGAITTTATTTVAEGTTFDWSFDSKPNSASKYGNCVAIDTTISNLAAKAFGLDSAPENSYSSFKVIRNKLTSPTTAMIPQMVAASAVAATITLDGVSTTFGEEGVTPEALGLGAGTYDALVQYTDANGETSAVYSLELTVDEGATINARETTIANGRGVKFDFNLTKTDGRAVSVWEISWGDGETTRSENLSNSWLAAHYYTQDGTFDVSLKVTYLDGTSETFEAFATRTVGTPLKATALDAAFVDVDELFMELESPLVYGPTLLR